MSEELKLPTLRESLTLIMRYVASDDVDNLTDEEENAFRRLSQWIEHERFPDETSSERQIRWQWFHRLWTCCVGTANYDKRAWMEVSRQLEAAGLIHPTEEPGPEVKSREEADES